MFWSSPSILTAISQAIGSTQWQNSDTTLSSGRAEIALHLRSFDLGSKYLMSVEDVDTRNTTGALREFHDDRARTFYGTDLQCL